MRHLSFIVLMLSASVVSFAQNLNKSVDYLQALEPLSTQELHKVIYNLDEYLKSQPKHGDAWYYRGLVKLFLGEEESACPDLEAALANGYKEDKKFIEYLCDSTVKLNFYKDRYYKKDTLYAELGMRPRYKRADTLRGSLRAERSCFDVHFYDLSIELDVSKKTIKGSNTIWFTVVEPTKRIQLDLFSIYTIPSITWHGQSLTFTREHNAIFIEFPTTLYPGEKHQVTVQYQGKPINAPNPPWDGGFVWKKDKKKNHWVGVACEHLGASSWWPVKDHPSDESDSLQISITAPADYDIVCNGNLISTSPVDPKRKRTSWFISYPINNYNVTFYMGKFTHFSDTIISGGKTLSLDYYVLPYNLEAAKKVFEQNSKVLAAYEKYYGEYPFIKDGYALIESPYAGMEHQSAIAYGNGYGKNNRLINKSWDYIIVHEAAHEWWGNSITGADMADMWIQEGFATYSEPLFLEYTDGHKAYLDEMSKRMQDVVNLWPMVQHYGVNENSFASNDVYYKGAVMLHNLRCILNNDSLFFAMIKGYAQSRARKVVSTEDFITYVNTFTAADHTAFFNKFLRDTKPPVLTYSYTKQSNGIVLKYKWTGVEKGFRMPLGIKTNIRSYRLEATDQEQEITLRNATNFLFFNKYLGPTGAEPNSFTYYQTRCLNIK